MNRKEFLRSLAAVSGALASGIPLLRAVPLPEPAVKHPRAIAMWDFSWLERRWPGAGYENWDQALDELVERGYDALRIDAYPHLVAAAANKTWLLEPVWNTQDWGAPALVRVRVVPELHQFIAKCRERNVKVGLSTWFREDESKTRQGISEPQRMAEIWNITLAGIREAGLLDAILYVDLCNEWPGPIWAPVLHVADNGHWSDARSLAWMRTAIAGVRAEFSELPLLFSTDNERVEDFVDSDVSFIDAIEHHLWMAGENNDEFYRHIGYHYERFSEAGYRNLQLRGVSTYAERPAYWQGLLTHKIARLASAARRAQLPLMTTECWAVVDYKDWPLLPWDWVRELCALGVESALSTAQWVAIATSNFCGPQFRGMWRDVAWHQQLTALIKSAPISEGLKRGRLWNRL